MGAGEGKMKKIFAILLLCALGLGVCGCAGSERFDVALRNGLFRGETDGGLTVCIEFSEMDRGEYVKGTGDRIKDLSTTDTKFFTAYHINLIVSEGSENYVMEVAKAAAKVFSQDTYRLSVGSERFGRQTELSDVECTPVDLDEDGVADELEVRFRRNGSEETAKLAFVSEGEEGGIPHRRFRYECKLTCDERIRFRDEETGTETGSLFWAGTELTFDVLTPEGCKVTMFVDGEAYAEIAPDGLEVMRFGYITGYRDVEIEFRSEKVE